MLLLRFDFLNEIEVVLLSGFVVRLASHRDVALGAFLGDRGGEFLPVENDLLKLLGIGGGTELLLKLFKERREFSPVAGVQIGRDKLACCVDGDFFKHQLSGG